MYVCACEDYAHVCVWVCVCVWFCACLYAHTACTVACAYMRAYVYMCMCGRVRACVYVYMKVGKEDRNVNYL